MGLLSPVHPSIRDAQGDPTDDQIHFSPWPDANPELAVTQDLAGLRAEHERLRAESAATRRELAEQQGPGARQAQMADQRAAAGAMRAGKLLPPAKAEQQRLAAIAELERRSAALRLALADVEADVAKTVTESLICYRTDILDHVQSTVQAALKHLEALDNELEVLGELHRTASWLRGGRKAAEGLSTGLTTGDPNGGTWSVADALSALMAVLVRIKREAKEPVGETAEAA